MKTSYLYCANESQDSGSNSRIKIDLNSVFQNNSPSWIMSDFKIIATKIFCKYFNILLFINYILYSYIEKFYVTL